LRTRYILALLLLIPLSLWGGSKTKKAQAPTKGSVAEGKKVFDADCNICHYADRAEYKMGPGLKGLFKNKLLPTSHKPVTDANVREQILKGDPHGKPMPMPAFGDQLKPEQVDSLMEYLKTL
jgi:mono/diheme cytochrome c family protein